MCVWSAYAGKKEAAPLLMEAIKKTEGVWAGFYTGLVTCCGGKLHFDKCMGHAAVFEKNFDLSAYPGTTGMIHSRTASGGGANRAHPFVGTEGITALVSQGSLGVFSKFYPRYREKALELYNEGRRLRSGSAVDGMRPIPELVMPDGKQVSLSDITVNLIEREYMRHGDMVKAMRTAGAYLLEESCSICVFADRPGVIGFINMNQRVAYSFEEDGVYLGTTMDAFPGAFMEIPANSVGYVTSDGVFYREPLGDFNVRTAVPRGLVPAVAAYLEAEPGAYLGHICDKAIRPCGFVQGELDYHAVAAYRTLETMLVSGMIRYEETILPGVNDVPGRIFKYYLK